MSLLFAQLEHQIRRTAATVGRAIVEKVTGFSDPLGLPLPADEPCDWQRDAAGLAKSEDHRGYYEVTPTCDESVGDDVAHGCYRDPAHDGDHGCLCGHTWPVAGNACRAPAPLDCLGCDYFGRCDYPHTSAVPPTAADDPAASTSQPAAGSPTLCCCDQPGVAQPCGPCRLGDDHACTHLSDQSPLTVPAGSSREGDSPAGLNWAVRADPGICEVLDKHFPQELTGGRYDCNPGTEMCPIWKDEQAWREHVAPLIFAQFFTKPQM